MQKETDRQRGTANQRGYTYRWGKYSKWFLQQPGNEICKLRIDGRCKMVAECVDHIVPPVGPNDPLFWDPNNHQASCLVCNSIKGQRTLKGTEWEV
jgi:5-methylcytosine-specific restriction protein A